MLEHLIVEYIFQWDFDVREQPTMLPGRGHSGWMGIIGSHSQCNLDINSAIKLNSHEIPWIKCSMAVAGADKYQPPILHWILICMKTALCSDPSFVSCVPTPLISVAHTLCLSVQPPTFTLILSLWHPIFHSFVSFTPLWTYAEARLPSVVMT